MQTAFLALRTNFIPGLILQAFALLLLILYYASPGVQSAFNAVAAVKDQYGLLFSGVSTSICAGFIPFLFVAYQQRQPGPAARGRGEGHPASGAAAAVGRGTS